MILMGAIVMIATAALGALLATKGVTSVFTHVMNNARPIAMLICAVGIFLIMGSHQLGIKIVTGTITAYIILRVVTA